MKRKKNKKMKAVLLLGTGILVAAAGIVSGAWSIPGSTLNYLTMASYKTEIAEQYEIPESVNPSQEIRKVVNVRNSGTVDTLVRVAVKKMFGVQDAEGVFQEDRNLDPEKIEILFNQTWWVQKEDGYFYYRDILKPGEMTKEPLFTSYRLSSETGNEYKKKDAQIIVTMESIQAEDDTVRIWGRTYEELGMTSPEKKTGAETAVHYLGSRKGFDITEKRTDLFSSFKDLTPGCGRTQIITLHNDSKESVELFLRAEAVGQEAMSREQLQMIRQLLNQYGIIKIQNGKTLLYHGPVSGVSDTNTTMKHNISLGKLAPGKKKNLTVTLSVDPAMDNRYQHLTGKVKWVFTAVGQEKTNSWPVTFLMPPRTGDDAVMGVWLILFLLSGGMLRVFLRKKSKGKHTGG